jgi:hypothetical protein
MHCRFGLLDFLEQHISLRARWENCGLLPYLFSPRDNPILKSDLMLEAATTGHETTLCLLVLSAGFAITSRFTSKQKIKLGHCRTVATVASHRRHQRSRGQKIREVYILQIPSMTRRPTERITFRLRAPRQCVGVLDAGRCACQVRTPALRGTVARRNG